MKKSKTKAKAANKHPAKGTSVYLWVIGFWFVYLVGVYNTPNETVKAAFDITERTAVMLRFTIAIPYLLMWLAIAYAFVKLLTYSNIIQKSKEMLSFRHFAYGTATLLGGLILTAILSGFSFIVENNSYSVLGIGLEPMFDTLVKYGHTFPYVVAFGFFFFATNKLRADEKIGFNARRFSALAIPIIGLAYVWLEVIFSGSIHGILASSQAEPTFQLRESVLVLTIIVPSLLAWFFAIGAVTNMRSYQEQIHGVIYKKALQYFVVGLTGMTLGSILLQALHSIGTEQLIGLSLSQLLSVIYFFLAIQAFGFIFMALGAKQLTKIETV